jgi:RNA polymerase sigma-70 factor (ECF subfamily)
MSDDNKRDEETLIYNASRGDKDAFGQLVITYQGLVYNILKSRVKNSEDAMDLAQEVFLKIWRSLPNWRGECRFSTWVYRVCINASVDFMRRSQHPPSESLSTKYDDDGDERPFEVADDSVASSPELTFEKNETSAIVRSAIDRLSDDQRDIIILRDIEGYSYEEIAAMLSLEIGTVKSRLNRARGNLREILATSGLLATSKCIRQKKFKNSEQSEINIV